MSEKTRKPRRITSSEPLRESHEPEPETEVTVAESTEEEVQDYLDDFTFGSDAEMNQKLKDLASRWGY